MDFTVQSFGDSIQSYSWDVTKFQRRYAQLFIGLNKVSKTVCTVIQWTLQSFRDGMHTAAQLFSGSYTVSETVFTVVQWTLQSFGDDLKFQVCAGLTLILEG